MGVSRGGGELLSPVLNHTQQQLSSGALQEGCTHRWGPCSWFLLVRTVLVGQGTEVTWVLWLVEQPSY